LWGRVRPSADAAALVCGNFLPSPKNDKKFDPKSNLKNDAHGDKEYDPRQETHGITDAGGYE
jgi:hypothetical protein